MIDLEKLFADKVFANIERERIKKGLDAIEIVNNLINLGVFSQNKEMSDIELKELKNSKRNLYNDWKTGKSKSFMKFIEELSKILGVAVEELCDVNVIHNNGNILNNSINESDNAVLLIAKETEQALSKQEWELIECYRSLSLKKQIEFVQFMLNIKEE